MGDNSVTGVAGCGAVAAVAMMASASEAASAVSIRGRDAVEMGRCFMSGERLGRWEKRG
jgi:hypothetical protein